MDEHNVRKHKRQLASGRLANVRRHARRSRGTAGEDARPEPGFDPERRAPVVGSSALSQPAPPPRESWWDDDGQGAAAGGDFWDAPEPEQDDECSSPSDPPPARRGDREMPRLLDEMRRFRSRPLTWPEREPVEPPELARALGCDTPEGKLRYDRGRAYRDAGYTGPLDEDSRIPDPDDPANYEMLHALAAMRESHG